MHDLSLTTLDKPWSPKNDWYTKYNSASENLGKPKYKFSTYEPVGYASSRIISRYEPPAVEVETFEPDIFTHYKPPKIEFPICESSISKISKLFYAPTIDDKINNAWTSKLLEEAGEIVLSTTTHIIQQKLSALASGATQCLITVGGLIEHALTDFVIGIPSRMLDYVVPQRYRDTGRSDVTKGIITGIATFAVTLNPFAALIPIALGFFRSLFRKHW